MTHLTLPAQLQTQRLLLSRLRYEDAEEIFYAYASKPEATRFVSWATHETVDDTRSYLARAVQGWARGTDYTYSIRLKNGILAGSIGALHDNGKVQIGYILGPVHWGEGYATEACRCLLTAICAQKAVYRICTFVDADNIASIKVLRKCGMFEEAVLPKWFRFVNHGNEPRDCILFRLKPGLRT